MKILNPVVNFKLSNNSVIFSSKYPSLIKKIKKATEDLNLDSDNEYPGIISFYSKEEEYQTIDIAYNLLDKLYEVNEIHLIGIPFKLKIKVMLTYLNWKELVELGLAGIASTVGLGIIGFCSWKILEITIILLINNPPIGITVGILTIAILGSIMLSASN